MPVFNNVDEARIALNETATAVAERALLLTWGAIENMCVLHRPDFPKNQYGNLVLFKVGPKQEDLFFDLYKQATQSLAPLFLNNDCPSLTKSCLLTLWDASVSTTAVNPMGQALWDKHNQLSATTNDTEEGSDYKKRVKLYNEYYDHGKTDSSIKSIKVKEIRALSNKLPLSSDIFVSTLNDHLVALSQKAQHIIEINKREVDLEQQSKKGMSP